MVSKLRIAALAAALSFVAGPAFAYIGPGAGLSVIAAFWALLTAVVSSVLFLVVWPLRNRLSRRKAARDGASAEPAVKTLDRPQPKLAHGTAEAPRR
jgi:hypothetical protein